MSYNALKHFYCTSYFNFCLLFRKYKTSKIAPFAANIGFLLMECEDGGSKIMTFLQEKPVKLPKCEDLACDWKTFKDIYAVRSFIIQHIVTHKIDNFV